MEVIRQECDESRRIIIKIIRYFLLLYNINVEYLINFAIKSLYSFIHLKTVSL